MSTDPLGYATTRGVNGYGVPTVSGFADMTSVVTTLGGQTPVDESYPEALMDEGGRVRDWSYDGTEMLSGAADLGQVLSQLCAHADSPGMCDVIRWIESEVEPP